MGKVSKRTGERRPKRSQPSPPLPPASSFRNPPPCAVKIAEQADIEFEAEQRLARQESDLHAEDDARVHGSTTARLRRRARRLLTIAPPAFDDPEDTAAFEQSLHEIVEAGEPLPVKGSGVDQRGEMVVFNGTAGMSLLGQPEVFYQWPVAYELAGIGILRDIVDDLYRYCPTKLRDSRRVFALRFNIAYEFEAVSTEDVTFDEHGELALFVQKCPQFRLLHTPACLRLVLLADLREGHRIPGHVSAYPEKRRPVWRKLKGKNTLTGLIQLPCPSRSWRYVKMPFSIARLEDPDEIHGDYTILDPSEFLEVMRPYDVPSDEELHEYEKANLDTIAELLMPVEEPCDPLLHSCGSARESAREREQERLRRCT